MPWASKKRARNSGFFSRAGSYHDPPPEAVYPLGLMRVGRAHLWFLEGMGPATKI
jgi:hypothetical protein